MFSRILKRKGRKRRRKRSNLGDSQRVEYRIVSLPNKKHLPPNIKQTIILSCRYFSSNHSLIDIHIIYRHKNRPRFLVYRARGGESSLGARISVVGHRRCVKAAPFRCSIFNKPRRLERVCVTDAREKEGKTKATLPRWNGIHAELPAFRRITLGLRNFHASS